MKPVTPVTVREGRGHSSALSNQSLKLPGQNWESLTQVRDSDKFLIPVGTDFVERDVLGISEEVHRVTGGKCRVASCQCGKCLEKGHYPHVVLEKTRGGHTSPVFGFTNFGPHIVRRLREIHVSNNPNKKSMQNNQKIVAERKRKQDEARQEGLEIVRAALESHKLDWKGPNGIRTRPF